MFKPHFILVLLMGSLSFAATPKDYVNLRKSAFADEGEMNDRWLSVVAMSKIQHKDREKDLLKALKNPSWYMRNVALLALETVNTKLALTEAIKLMEDPSLVVRSAAVDVVAKSSLTSSPARMALWKELRDKQNKTQGKSLWIRPQIMQHLVQTAQPKERPLFLGYLEDENLEVKSLAREALLKIK